MSVSSLVALAGKGADGVTVLAAPKVGWWSDQPADGALVTPGSAVGTLTQLNRRFVLLVPEGVSGRVAITGRPHDALPVGYGEPLFRVEPMTGVDAGAGTGGPKASRSVEGILTIGAPTAGVFYRSPALGATPYVAVGERLVPGRPIGLIEVMKTFNPIVFGGPGFPDEAEVVEILASDGQEVLAGEPLVAVKKL